MFASPRRHTHAAAAVSQLVEPDAAESSAQPRPEATSQTKHAKKTNQPRGPETPRHGDESQVLLHGIFKLKKKSHDVLLTPTLITWTPILPEPPTGAGGVAGGVAGLQVQQVYAVKVKRRRGAGQQTGGAVLGITLFYGRRRSRRLLQDSLHLHSTSLSLCHAWCCSLGALLRGFSRPRNLKVFINPASHKKEAVHVYREHVAPLFKMADVNTDITITEGKGHVLSLMKDCEMDGFDGVVCVGGDGSVSEVVHSLVLRAQLDRSAVTPARPVRPVWPLGIIPAGSTDVISCSVHGVRDAVTAALHIVLGHVQQADMLSVEAQDRLVTFGFSAMLGFGGRCLALAERHRWMPPSQRQDFAFATSLAKLRPEECELSFLPVKKRRTSLIGERCDQQGAAAGPEETGNWSGFYSPASPLSSSSPSSSSTQRSWIQGAGAGRFKGVLSFCDWLLAEGERSWTTSQGLYLSVSVMSIPCLVPHAPHGLAPTTSLANGSAALIAVGNTSRSEFIKHLKRYSSPSGQLAFPFVESHTVAAVRVCPRALVGWPVEQSEEEGDSKATPITQSEGAFPWNIDGELVEIPNDVLIRVHPRLISLYGEDVEEFEAASVSCICL